MNHLSEQALVALAQAGLPHDSRHFEILVRPYVPKLRVYCANLLSSRAEGEDATQEVLIKVLLKLKQFRYEKTFTGWLFTIAHNECIDRLRLRRHFVDIDTLADILESSADSTQDLAELVDSLLPRLNLVDREIFLLRTLSGMEFGEIADTLAMKLSAVKMRHKRMLEFLRETTK